MTTIDRVFGGTFLAFFLLLAPPARAERVLSLDEALTLARAHNRDLRAARARLAQSATSVEQAWAALRPQLSVQGKYTHNYKAIALDLSQSSQGLVGLAEVIRATSGNAAENAALGSFEQSVNAAGASQKPITIQPSEQLDGAATLTVPLVVPWAYGALSAARLGQRSNTAGFEVTEASVLLSVAQSYYAAAGTDELLLARQHAITVAKDTWQNARARLAAGFVNQVEVMRAEVALVRAEQDAAEAENSRASAYRALATLLGTREAFRVEPVQAAPPPAPEVANLVEGALRLRPELAQYRLAIDSARASARSSGWRWAPALSAFGNVRAFNYTGFSGDQYSWAAGGQLDWMLYDGGTRDAQRHLAAAQRLENEVRLELLHDSVTVEVQNARGTLDTKRRAVEAARRALDLSRETLRLVRAQYEAGSARQLDVLAAQDSLVFSEVGVAQAHFDLALSDLQLRRAAGIFPGIPPERSR